MRVGKVAVANILSFKPGPNDEKSLIELKVGDEVIKAVADKSKIKDNRIQLNILQENDDSFLVSIPGNPTPFLRLVPKSQITWFYKIIPSENG